ncbi:MAG: 50S ribosomal protein L18, partial [Thermoplasmatota archaeon]
MHLSGTTARPRLAVFRSLQHIYAQVIDDTSGTTLVAAQSTPTGGVPAFSHIFVVVMENKEIGDVIRYFGTRGKIFNVHFRNIRGGCLNFRETFPDDGDVDMLQALRVYK